MSGVRFLLVCVAVLVGGCAASTPPPRVAEPDPWADYNDGHERTPPPAPTPAPAPTAAAAPAAAAAAAATPATPATPAPAASPVPEPAGSSRAADALENARSAAAAKSAAGTTEEPTAQKAGKRKRRHPARSGVAGKKVRKRAKPGA